MNIRSRLPKHQPFAAPLLHLIQAFLDMGFPFAKFLIYNHNIGILWHAWLAKSIMKPFQALFECLLSEGGNIEDLSFESHLDDRLKRTRERSVHGT